MTALLATSDRQLRPPRGLSRGLAGSGAQTRSRLIALALVFVSASQAEVDLRTFCAKIGGFFSYIGRLATLDSGQRVWTDPAEWFWSFKRIARLLGETVLMAYVGTLTGAIVAFALNFVASPNLTRNPLHSSFAPGAFWSSAAPFRNWCSRWSSSSPSASDRCPACWRSPSIPPARSASCSSK